jgi:NAD(P)-dependent dehydrogenase (short-subunit alcohol dehydrogenase family)
MKNPKSILITGGSSGIGEALLIHYAAPGITLAFNGRNQARLDSVAEKVRAKGANVFGSRVDVTDAGGMESWIKDVDRQSPLDLVIANAGIGTVTTPTHSRNERVKAVYDVNVFGVFNTIHPALDLMLERKRGQIAIVSSIAGFMGLPGSPAYSSSKAAVKAYGRSLRSRYRNRGIKISVICPGMIHTPMTEGWCRKFPGWIEVEPATRYIIDGLEHDRGLIAFPWHTVAMVRFLASLPEPVQDGLFSWYEKRKHDGAGTSDI